MKLLPFSRGFFCGDMLPKEVFHLAAMADCLIFGCLSGILCRLRIINKSIFKDNEF